MATKYDAIIVGSSHNALVTAAYLTRLGGVCWCWRRMIDQAVSTAPRNEHCRVSTTMPARCSRFECSMRLRVDRQQPWRVSAFSA